MKTTGLLLVALTFCVFGPATANKKAEKAENKVSTAAGANKKPANEGEGEETDDKNEEDANVEEDEAEAENPPTRNLWGQVHDMIEVEAKELEAAKKKELVELVKEFLKGVEGLGITAMADLIEEADGLEPDEMFTHEKEKLRRLRRMRRKRRMMRGRMRRMRRRM